MGEMSTIYFTIVFAILIFCEIIYIRIARKYMIGAKQEQRSSHRGYKLSGGGIIFILAAWLYCLLGFNNPWLSDFGLMVGGASALAIVSFADDIKNLSPKARLLVQVLVVGLTFYPFIISEQYDIFLLILLGGIGFINAYNFMDGIDGMMAGYSLVTLSTLYYCCHYLGAGVDENFVLTILLSVGVFSIFNFRRKALCFAGDVGSIVMGFFILYLMVDVIKVSHNASILIFLIVYGIDTVFTIFQRLFAGENILLPHRLHLYQKMANQWHIPHYKISSGYALTQLVVNVGYFMIPTYLQWTYFILITTILTIAYFMLKFPALRHTK